jgi:hypothetical protein
MAFAVSGVIGELHVGWLQLARIGRISILTRCLFLDGAGPSGRST